MLPVVVSAKTRGLLTIFAFSGARARHLDDVDAEERGARIVFRILARAFRELFARTDRARARHVDVDVVLVLRGRHQRVRVRSTAGLDRGHLLGILQIAHVEDPHAAEAFGAHRRRHALHAAIDAAARLLHRHEEQVPVDRHVALSARTDDGCQQARPARVLDVVGVEAVVVADDRLVALEGEVGIREA